MRYWKFCNRCLLGIFLCSIVLTGPEAAAQEKLSGIESQYRSNTISAGENFYLHVNEGWLQTTTIPADQSNYGSFSVLDDQVKAATRELIQQAADTKPAWGTDEQRVGDFYNSYINVQHRNPLGIRPLQPLLDEIAAAKNMQQLAVVAGKLMRLGVTGPLALYIAQDAKQSDRYTVYISQSGLTLPDRDYYLKENPQFIKARADLQQYIEAMLQFTGHQQTKRAAAQIYKLEHAIALIQWDRVRNRDPEATYNKLNGAELRELLSSCAIDDYLSSVQLQQRETFVARQPDYLKSLNAIITATSLNQWKNYYTYRVLDAFGNDLSEEIEHVHFTFHATALSGVEEQKPLWRRGVEACNGVLGEIVGKLYVEKHFPPEAKDRMEQLVENLKSAFAKRIDGLDWMSPVTKQQAREKLSKFSTKIGYPSRWKDYSKLEIRADDLVGNYLRANEVEFQRRIERLNGPVDRDEWMMTPQTINAYYSATMNEIVFPAAILQPPFFNLQADDAVNYGGIGAVIGHEISHGFDDKGSQYDGDGNLRRWWSVEDRSEFERRADQLVLQYDSYKPFADMNVNGKFTLGENIGDLGGMAVAYEAYQISLSGQTPPVIDGLTGQQRFFMGWAQIWRRLYREPELRKRLVNDPHSPSEYRCNGILSNMDAFYECFGIKPNDPMYIPPEARVRIW